MRQGKEIRMSYERFLGDVEEMANRDRVRCCGDYKENHEKDVQVVETRHKYLSYTFEGDGWREENGPRVAGLSIGLAIGNYGKFENIDSSLAYRAGLYFFDGYTITCFEQNKESYKEDWAELGYSQFNMPCPLKGGIVNPGSNNITLVVDDRLISDYPSRTEGDVPEDIWDFFNLTTNVIPNVVLHPFDKIDKKLDTLYKYYRPRGMDTQGDFGALWTNVLGREDLFVYNRKTREVIYSGRTPKSYHDVLKQLSLFL